MEVREQQPGEWNWLAGQRGGDLVRLPGLGLWLHRLYRDLAVGLSAWLAPVSPQVPLRIMEKKGSGLAQNILCRSAIQGNCGSAKQKRQG